MSVTLDEFAGHFRGPAKRAGGRSMVFCPSHEDAARQSLALSQGDDGRLLVHCFAGCTTEKVLAAVGLELKDLFPPSPNGHHQAAPRIVQTYDYSDGAGELLYQVVRYEPKDFRQRRPDGAFSWTWSLGDVRRVPYRLRELAEQSRVYWTEGEKDADRLAGLGLAATTAAGGAKAWRAEYAEQLAALGAREVVILPDNDEPGRQYAAVVAGAACAQGLAVHIVQLPGVGPKGDVSNWLDAGHTRDELEALVTATPTVEGGIPPSTKVEVASPAPYIETLAAFLAEDDPPLSVVFPEMLPCGVIMLLHGEPRARKSLVGFELALAAATGTAPFGLQRLAPATPITVLYIQEEDPRALTRPRLRRLVAERCGARVPETLHVSVRRGADLDDPVWVAQLIADLKRLGARLLVLDAARRFSIKTDEGPAKVRELIAVLRSIVTAGGVTLVIVHHDVKPPASGQDLRRRGQRASGGDWFAGCECPVHVERLNEADSLVYPQDYKFSADPAPFTFTCELDGHLIKRLVGRDTTTEHAETAGARGKLLDWIRANGPASKTAMKKAGFGWETITPMLDGLLRDGAVDAMPGRTAKSQIYFADKPSSGSQDSSPSGRDDES